MTSLCPQCGRTFDDEQTFCDRDDVLLISNHSTTRYLPPCVGDRLGAYRLVERIGVGGMAMIFRAEDLGAQREVAVKVLRPERAQDVEMVTRFSREAYITRLIRHPNIVKIFDVVDSDAADPFPPYMAMELLGGQDLRHRLRESPVLDPNDVRKLGQEVAGTLAAVHRSGVLHRDVKPDNIFLERRNPDREPLVKLLDFGVALGLDLPGITRLTRHGSCVGTPEYLSPEQVLGREMDERSDIYGLGLVMYEMLAGRPALQASSCKQTLMAQIDTYPEPIIKYRGAPIPPALDDVVARCLRKRPDDRYSSMDELWEALHRCGATS
jgi:serine/threonine-protein kinase